jgi:predicted PurR-regulated permease PerM
MFKGKFFAWLLVLAVIMSLLYLLSDVLLPFIVGGVIAYCFNPVVSKLEKFFFSRSLATIVVIGLLLIIIFLLFLIALPPLTAEVEAFIGKLPGYKTQLQTKVFPWATAMTSKIDPTLAEHIKKFIEGFSDTLVSQVMKCINAVWSSSLAVINIISLVFITPIIAFYLLRDWNNIVIRLKNYLPVKQKEVVLDIFKEIDSRIAGYIRGQINVCMILAVYYVITLSFVGLDFSLLIGVASGVLTFIPYIGVLAGISAALLAALLQGMSSSQMLIIIMIFVVAQIVEGNFITPKLVGEKIGLHPVWIIFAMLAGASLFGFKGLLLALPVAAILVVFVNFIIDQYIKSSLYSG